MAIGIIGAMTPEIELINNKMTQKNIEDIQGYQFISGKIKQRDVVLLQSGIGKVNAAIGTTLLNYKYRCESVINIGSAGGFSDELHIGDIVIATELRNHDVDVTAFNYEYGQIPKMPAFFKSDTALVKMAEHCAKEVHHYNIVQGLIVSGDSFLNNTKQIAFIKQKFNHVLAAEMEACAIAQVCYQFKNPVHYYSCNIRYGGQRSAY